MLTDQEIERVHEVVDALIQQLERQKYTEHESLPSDFELAREFNTTRSVIQEALDTLEEREYVTQRYGVGVFVNAQPLFEAGIEQLASVSSMIRAAGSEPGTIYLDIQQFEVDEELKEIFQIEKEEALVAMKRVRTADDVPVVYCIDYAYAKQVPLDNEGLYNDSIFETIERTSKRPIVRAVAQIEPVGYDEEASTHLRCGVDVPLLALYQKHYNDLGEVVLYSKNYFRADKFKFQVVRTK